jgi:hypothetical protein
MNVFRAAFSSDFWITGIAIARYIPRAFRTKQIDGNLFFTKEKRQEYRRRVESVTLNSRRKGGPWKSTRCFTISTLHAEVRKASTIFLTRAI